MSPLSFDSFPSSDRSAVPYSIDSHYPNRLVNHLESPTSTKNFHNSFYTQNQDCWQQTFEGGDSESAIYSEPVLGNSAGEIHGVNGVYDDATNSFSNINLSGTTKTFLSTSFQDMDTTCDPSCSYTPSYTYMPPAAMHPAENKDLSSYFAHGSTYDPQMTYQDIDFDDHTFDVEEQYYDYYGSPNEHTRSPTSLTDMTDDANFSPVQTDLSSTACWPPAGTMTTDMMHYPTCTKDMSLMYQQEYGDDPYLDQWYKILHHTDPSLHPIYPFYTGPCSYPMHSEDPAAACSTPSDFTSSDSPLSPLDPESCSDAYSTLSPYSSLAPLPTASLAPSSSSEPAQISLIPIHAPRPTRAIPVISFERLVAASNTLDHFREEAT